MLSTALYIAFGLVGAALIIGPVLDVLNVSEMDFCAAWKMPAGRFAVHIVSASSLIVQPFLGEIQQPLGDGELGKRPAQQQASVFGPIDELKRRSQQENRFSPTCGASEKRLTFPIHRERQRLASCGLDWQLNRRRPDEITRTPA